MINQDKKIVDGTNIELYDQAPWSRTTVADGKWLQQNTLDPISANDRILASAIHDVSATLQDEIDYLGDELYNTSSYLEEEITKINARADVIDVVGNHEAFEERSAHLVPGVDISDRDVIKVLNDIGDDIPAWVLDNGSYVLSSIDTNNQQSYYRWLSAVDGNTSGWEYVGSLEPYYKDIELSENTITFENTAPERNYSIKADTNRYIQIAPYNHDASIGLSDDFINSANLAFEAYDALSSISGINDGSITGPRVDHLVSNFSLAQGSANSASYYSFSQGLDNSAENDSLAQGANNKANNRGQALGFANSANSDGFAAGQNNSADNNSFAQGNSNKAEMCSFAQGSSVTATSTSLAQGQTSSAYYNAFAQGLNGISITASFAQGENPSAHYKSFAQGSEVSAYSISLAQGNSAIAKNYSIAQGYKTSANYYSFAQGYNVSAGKTIGCALAQGNDIYVEQNSFGQGSYINSTVNSFAQGVNCSANNGAFAQGTNNSAASDAFAQGSGNNATSKSFAQGLKNNANNNSVAIGNSNSADFQSFAVGIENKGTYEGFSHGKNNESNADSLAQGDGNSATTKSLAQGLNNYADKYSLAQGQGNNAKTYSLAQGISNSANSYAAAFGNENNVSETSIAQGNANTAVNMSLAQGQNNSANQGSLSQGLHNSSNAYSVALGDNNTAKHYSMAEGYRSSAYAFSIAEGYCSSAKNCSQAFGEGTVATASGMSIGTYNETYNAAFVIGNGTDDDHRSDLVLINKNGDTTSIGAAYFTGFSGTNISGLNQTASIDNLINSAANGGGMTAVKSISGFTIDNSTGPTQEIELQSSADHLSIVLSGSIKNSITLYGQQDTYGSHYLYIQGTELLKTADFADWYSSTANVFSGTSRSAQNAGSAGSAEYFGGKLPSAYMQVANIGRDANGNISSYGGSAIAGLGDYVPKSATNCPIGTNNTAVSYAFAQGVTNSADTTAFAQGDSNNVSFVSFAQGDTNTAANYSLAQGWKSSAERHSMVQGVNNTAYNLSFAQGELNFADGLSLAQGEKTLARWASIAQGSATSATNRSQAFGEGTVANASGMAIGTYNNTYDATFVIGNGTSDSNRSDLLVVDHNGNMSITAIYPNKQCSATYSPSGIHIDDSVPNGYDVYLTNEGVITTGYDGDTPIPMSARWLDIIDPRKDYVSAMGALPIVISAVTNLPLTLQEGIYYLV